MGPNCKTSGKFIGITKKKYGQKSSAEHLRTLVEKKMGGKDRLHAMKSAWKSRFFIDIRS